MINDNVGAQPAAIVQNTEYERQSARTIRQDGVDRAGRSVFCQSCLGLFFDEQQEKEGVFVNLSIYRRTAQFRLCVGKPSGSIFDLKNLQLRTCESLDMSL